MVNMTKAINDGSRQAVSLIKGSTMLVFMADQIAYALNAAKPSDEPRMSRFDGESDRQWVDSMFTVGYCQ